MPRASTAQPDPIDDTSPITVRHVRAVWWALGLAVALVIAAVGGTWAVAAKLDGLATKDEVKETFEARPQDRRPRSEVRENATKLQSHETQIQVMRERQESIFLGVQRLEKRFGTTPKKE